MWDPVGVDDVDALYPLEPCNGPNCRRPIRRVETTLRTRMPLDPDPVPDATVVIRRNPATGDVRAHVLAGSDPRGAAEVTWRPHWATCPNSDVFRRRKHATIPRCVGCREPLDPVLATRDGWESRYHATCAPRPRPAGPEPTHEQGAIDL